MFLALRLLSGIKQNVIGELMILTCGCVMAGRGSLTALDCMLEFRWKLSKCCR